MITLNDCRQANQYKFKGTATDPKPANCAVNSLFLVLNGGNFYYFDGTDWLRVGG